MIRVFGLIGFPPVPTQRLGKLVGGFASWSPDGGHIAYTKGGSVYVTPDGRRIIAVGVKPEGQLLQYDSRSGHWLPYLAGISAHSLDFSRDNEWVTYVDLASKNLWRSKIDGTQPQPLTGSDFLVASPRFSPDGTSIAFLAGDPPVWKNTQLYLVAAEGGAPELLIEGARPRSLTWSPHGNQIAFDNNASGGIEILDLNTRLAEMIPGSNAYWYPQWSPNGRYIAALGRELNELMLFDSKTDEWSKVGENADYPEWSRQGRPCIYYIRDHAAFRMQVTDGITEKVADFEFGLAGGYDDNPRWIGLAPDDSVLTLRRESLREIYALDFKPP